jgi:hypothetical protein
MVEIEMSNVVQVPAPFPHDEIANLKKERKT